MKLESEEDRRQSSCITEVQEEVWTQKKSLSGFYFYKSIQESKIWRTKHSEFWGAPKGGRNIESHKCTRK